MPRLTNIENNLLSKSMVSISAPDDDLYFLNGIVEVFFELMSGVGIEIFKALDFARHRPVESRWPKL